jgi:hypothetical protein
MSLALYKPNSKNAGCAFSFRIGTNKKFEPTLYVSAIQQFGWDSSKRSGNFSGNKDDPDKNINVKFNEFEIGGILSAFKNRNEYSAFHSFEENKTSIKFTPWDKPVKIVQNNKEATIKVPAFGAVFTRNGNQTFRIPLEPGEVETLSEFLKFFLHELYKHRRREEIKLHKNKKSTEMGMEKIPAKDTKPYKPPSDVPF